MSRTITVLSVWEGKLEYVTLVALEKMKKSKSLVLQTNQCELATYLKEQGIAYETLDALYEQADSFEALQENSVQFLMKKAKKYATVFVVFDAFSDSTVQNLRQNIPLTIAPYVSPSSILCEDALVEPTRISASDCLLPHTENGLLVTELDSKLLCGKVKLELLKQFDESHPVTFFPSKKSKKAKRTIPLMELDWQKEYDHTTAVYLPPLPMMEKNKFTFLDLVEVMRVLRSENGCAWDKAQTHESLAPFLIEEAYEAMSAIQEEDGLHMAEELGDVLLQVVFHANVGEQYGTLDLSDITTSICKKLIERHPHIFGEGHASTPKEVEEVWDKIKQKQRGLKTTTQVLKDVPKGLPPMMRAAKVQKKAAKVGFDFDSATEALQKVYEEADEVAEVLENPSKLSEELGDLLFACVNVLRLCDINGEDVLMKSVEKFISRFEKMENAIIDDRKSLKDLTISEMNVYWDSGKSLE